MARKVEQQLIEAIRAGRPFSGGNTVVAFDEALNRWFVELHGNEIADWSASGGSGFPPTFSWSGWVTPTTRSRLNAVAEALGYGEPFSIQGGVACGGEFAMVPGRFYTAAELGLEKKQ